MSDRIAKMRRVPDLPHGAGWRASPDRTARPVTSLLLVLAGLALLVSGGDLLVRGAVRIATRLGVSPLVIGLTLVGFGTSTPELVTSIQAALAGSPGIAYGNVVGSNIANILLILGVAALVSPILVTSAALRRDGAIMLATAAGFALLGALLPLDRLTGAAFLLLLAGYIYLAFRQESRGAVAGHGAVHDKSIAAQVTDPALAPPAAAPLGRSVLLAAGGLALVLIGGNLLVEGAVGLARSLGISETVIGLTIVAVGTSMPELVTSVMAAFRRESEVAFGNVVGSNIYNILGIGGATALMAPGALPAEIVRFDNLVMIGATVMLLVLARSGHRISRAEGGLMLALYAGYLWSLWP
jgi:cation:H+ antiporter